MKQLLLSALLLTATVVVASETASTDVQIAINSAFMPETIDAKSELAVVVSGLFSNGCYRWRNAEVEDKTDFEHEVRSYATVTQGMCIMVLVPFQKEIKFGLLKAGEHTFRFANGDGTYLEKTLTVR